MWGLRFRPLLLMVFVVGGISDPGQAKGSIELISRLAGLGSRSPGGPGHLEAQQILLTSMREAGLQGVRQVGPVGDTGWVHLTGSLPGRQATEVVLTAHYDAIEGSPGILDNASGVAVSLEAVRELGKLPRQHAARVLLTDGEEDQGAGGRAWTAALSAADRESILANLNVDMVGERGSQGVGIVHVLAGWKGEHRIVSPAWLVHAVLRAGEATGMPLAVLDPRWSWLVRCALPGRRSDGRSFVESGIPSVTLSDLSWTAHGDRHHRADETLASVDTERLHRWTATLVATARRLDGLEDRPTWETEYLVLAGRVWIRRDLVWLGFLLWIVLVWRGLPGTWRRRDPAGRRRTGRAYLPGFAFRMLFLLAVFWIPTFATLLLYPLAILGVVPTLRSLDHRQVLCALGALPTAAFAAWLTIGQWAGWFILDRGALLPCTLVVLTLATFCAWRLDSPADGNPSSSSE